MPKASLQTLLLQVLLTCLLAVPSPLGAGPAESPGAADRPGRGPGEYRILSKDRVIRFPFELYRGDVRFEGEVNGRKVHMLIDNGIMWDPILFFGSPVIDSLNLAYDGEIEVRGGGEGNPVASRTASGITIRFPGVEFTGQTAIVTPYESGLTNMWEGTEGQVSGTFLKHFVVEFDFDEMMMTLIEPDRFRYSGEGAEVSMTPLTNGGWSIPATVLLGDGRRLSLDLMMDLGLGEQLEISTTGEHRITVPKVSLPGSLGFGVQGETLGRYGRIKSVEIGGYSLPDVIGGFIDENHTGAVMHEITVGLGLLSRFNFIYDYPHRRMFLEPNRRFKEPFEHNMSGLQLRGGPGEYLVVHRVHPGSPAERAGLKPGDRITLIDGRPAADYDTWELRPFLRREGAVVELSVQREGAKDRSVSIKLRRLI